MIAKVNEYFAALEKTQHIKHLHLDPNLEFLDLKFKGKAIEHSIFVEWKKSDLLIPFYPLSVIVTNRLANDYKSSLMRQVSLIRNCSPQGLMVGFLPYLALSTYTCFDFHLMHRKPGDLIYSETSLNMIPKFVKILPY